MVGVDGHDGGTPVLLPPIEIIPDDELRRERATSLNRLCNIRDWEPGRGLSPILKELGEPPIVHRKPWEYGICIEGLTKLGCVKPEARALSVGAGYEKPLFYFANKIELMMATDLYDNPEHEGKPAMLTDPASFSPIPYRTDHLQTMRMSGDNLHFPDNSYDFVFCLSSIEHFGDEKVIRNSISEMTRVLRSNGVLCIITEFSLNTEDQARVFKPAEIEVFSPREIENIFLNAPGLILVGGDFDLRIQKSLMDYPVDLSYAETASLSPHIVLNKDGCVFTSLSMFFRKQ